MVQQLVVAAEEGGTCPGAEAELGQAADLDGGEEKVFLPATMSLSS